MSKDLLSLERQLNPAPLTRVEDPLLRRHAIELWIKREDLLHPIISGNKWRKLKYPIAHALALGCDRLASMGGAYSNHLHALAFAGRALGLRTFGLIRGEKPQRPGPTLQDLETFGMALAFVPRAEYRALRLHTAWNSAPGRQHRAYWIPEGGACPLALEGVMEMVRDIDIPYDGIALACGTGTTLAGVAAALPRGKKVLGFAVLKGAGYLMGEVEKRLAESGRSEPVADWTICLDYHLGGFGKVPAALAAFMARFEDTTGIALDPVYTGKMLYGLYDLIGRSHFAPGRRIVAIHTGGLQGRRGFPGLPEGWDGRARPAEQHDE